MSFSDSEKYVFISDIHLGDQNSFCPAETGRYAYGWTNTHTAELTAFLNDRDLWKETRGANGIMIVGDLLDAWVCPAKLPPPDFESVLSAKHNRSVIQALNAVAGTTRLMYIPGNHDMLLKPDELRKHIPDIDIVGNATGNKMFYDGHLAVEHGHRYCLFNAVDKWSRPNVDGHLPLGYFISRLAAEGAFEKNDKINYLEILKEYIGHFHPDTAFAKQILDAIAAYETKDVGVDYTSPFITNGVDGFDAGIAYDRVRHIYGDIYDQWDGKSDSGIPATVAAGGDAGYLKPAADIKYLFKGEIGGPVKIAIFGHTHIFEISPGVLREASDGSCGQAGVIYGNCGTWIDAKPCTFIVTERCSVAGQDRIYVRGYAYALKNGAGEITLKKEAYVIV